jgi:hypothetical protein
MSSSDSLESPTCHHFQSFRGCIQDIAFLLSQWLDGDNDFVAARDVAGHLKKFGDLLTRARAWETIGNLWRPRAAPHHNGSPSLRQRLRQASI